MQYTIENRFNIITCIVYFNFTHEGLYTAINLGVKMRTTQLHLILHTCNKHNVFKMENNA